MDTLERIRKGREGTYEDEKLACLREELASERDDEVGSIANLCSRAMGTTYLLLLLLRSLDDQLRCRMDDFHLLHDGCSIARDEYFVELIDHQLKHA